MIVAVVGSVDQEKTTDSLLGTAHYRAAPLPTHGIHQTNDPTTPAHIGGGVGGGRLVVRIGGLLQLGQTVRTFEGEVPLSAGNPASGAR